jgi:hypothetical protein
MLARRLCTVCARQDVRVRRRWIIAQDSPFVLMLHRHRWTA